MPDMSDERYAILLASIKAQELLLRSLWTVWLLSEPDPRDASFRKIEALIASMHAVRSGKADMPEVEVLGLVEDELRAFAENVDKRLAALAVEIGRVT